MCINSYRKKTALDILNLDIKITCNVTQQDGTTNINWKVKRSFYQDQGGQKDNTWILIGTGITDESFQFKNTLNIRFIFVKGNDFVKWISDVSKSLSKATWSQGMRVQFLLQMTKAQNRRRPQSKSNL